MYYHYGEGGVMHYEGLCPEGYGFDHPEIHRTEWPSRWHYLRNILARWYFHREMRRLIFPDGQVEDGTPKMARFRWSPFDRPARWLFGPAFPHMPTIHAPIRNEDSIYERRRSDPPRDYPVRTTRVGA